MEEVVWQIERKREGGEGSEFIYSPEQALL
jgi:hypothetical protein